MEFDRLGRKRRPEQDQGLRPLHPALPNKWTSRAIRVAMSDRDWERFDGLRDQCVDNADSTAIPSQARANGELISRLMESADVRTPVPAPTDWLDWERQKTLRLLRAAV